MCQDFGKAGLLIVTSFSKSIQRTHAIRYGSALLLCTAQNAMLLLVSLLATHAIPALQRLQTPAQM